MTGSAPDLVYTPEPDWSGTDDFTFKVSDGKLESEIAQVRIVVLPVNDAPVAHSAALETDEDVPLALTLGAFDPDSGSLAYTIVDSPTPRC